MKTVCAWITTHRRAVHQRLPLFLTLLLFPLSVCTCVCLSLWLSLPLMGVTCVALPLIVCTWFTQQTKPFLLIVFGALAVNALVYSSFTMFTDSDFYHMPAVRLLLAGWNPIASPHPEQIAKFISDSDVGALCNIRHIAFLPKASWYFGAAMAHFTGWTDAGNCLVFLLLAATWLLVRKSCGRTTTAILCLAPWVFECFFDAMVDGLCYLLMLHALFAMKGYLREQQKSHLAAFAGALVFLACLKFTGTIFGGIATLTFAVCVWRRKLTWTPLLKALSCAVVLFCLCGTAPYLTNLFHYHNPIYPVGATLALDHPDNITQDFNDMNDDAREMSAAGRFCHAYLSQTLVRYWYQRPDAQPFNPQVALSFGGINGLGTPFRVAMVLALCALPWLYLKRREQLRELAPLLFIIFVSSLIIPTHYVGYVRYVPQLYLFPMLILTVAFPLVAIPFAVAACAIPVAWIGWRGFLSTQNIALYRSVSSESAIVCQSAIYNCRAGLRELLPATSIFFDPAPTTPPLLTSGSLWYRYYGKPDVDFPELVRPYTGMSQEYLKPRSQKMRELLAYAWHDYLPWFSTHGHRYLLSIVSIRMKQSATNAWHALTKASADVSEPIALPPSHH